MRLLIFLFLIGVISFSFLKKTTGFSCENIQKSKITILNKVPHDRSIFTQGLVRRGDQFIESSGGFGKSFLRIYNEEKTLKNIFLPPQIFAEGIEVYKNQIFLITWRSEMAYIFDRHSFDLISKVPYLGEGWGLASKDDLFYMSNGSDLIQVFDNKFKKINEKKITYLDQNLGNLNEMELIENILYANIWQSRKIIGIDFEKGCVVREIDATEIVEMEQNSSPESVLNGIAYDKKEKKIYLTGKNWSHLYQVTWD